MSYFKNENVKNVRCGFRLSESEHAELLEFLSRENIKNLSEFVRLQISHKPILRYKTKIVYDDNLLFELSQIGKNINQLAHKCNISKDVDLNVLSELVDISDRLNKLVFNPKVKVKGS